MRGQMCWLYPGGLSNVQRVLHLRAQAEQPWQPYTHCHEFMVADHNIPGGSKGWATYQLRLREGWQVVASTGHHSLSHADSLRSAS